MKALGLAAAALGLLAVQARAADEAAVLRLRAEQLAAQDRCDEAVPRAERARELDPEDARAALVIGRCALHAGEYADAIEPLEDARRLDPSLEGVSTDLAQCHYHLEQLDRAESELERALQRNPDDARALLYRGLVLLSRSENAEAGAVLDRAGRLDPSVRPAASYYAGLAWEYARDRENAEQALEQARAADPDGPWGREAERALDRLEAPYQRHRWAQLKGGVEYDSNAALSADRFPPDPLLGVDFDEQGDARGVFEGQLGLELLRDPDWSAGLIGGFQGSAYADLHTFDLRYPYLSAWLDHRLDEVTWLRLLPYGGYQWLDTSPFLLHGGLEVSLDRQLTDPLLGRLYARYSYNDYLFPIHDDPLIASIAILTGNPLVNDVFQPILRDRRNRDGSDVEAGFELTFGIASTETTLRGGAALEYYDARGKDWDHKGVRGWVGFDQELPAELFLQTFASFAHRPYDHVSSYSAPNVFIFGPFRNRIDNVWEVGGTLERPITDFAKLGIRVYYGNSDSNVGVFDYDRLIAGGYFTLVWGS